MSSPSRTREVEGTDRGSRGAVFPLAVMTSDMRALTAIVLGLPILSFVMVRGVPVAKVATLIVPLLYLAVWLLFRPRCFVIDAETLRIEWPLRTRPIALSTILNARVISSQELNRAHGRGIRVGAGGLWGSFGLLVTRDETFSMWISRTDRFVVVSIAGARPLLLTPDQPEAFVGALGVKS